MKILKKVITIIITTLLVLLLLFNVYNFINIKILKKELPTIGGYAMLEVVSGSMEPTIKVGDIIIIDTKDKDIKENDIITFKDTNNAFVTHRLITLNDTTMITKGDYNNSNDEEMPRANIIGKYKFKINSLGRLINSLKNPFTSIMILIIGILICYLLSTDSKGNPILDENKEEFMAYLKAKENNELDTNNKVKKEEVKEVKSTKKNPTKKTTTKEKTKKEETIPPKTKKSASKKSTTKSKKKTKKK